MTVSPQLNSFLSDQTKKRVFRRIPPTSSHKIQFLSLMLGLSSVGTWQHQHFQPMNEASNADGAVMVATDKLEALSKRNLQEAVFCLVSVEKGERSQSLEFPESC